MKRSTRGVVAALAFLGAWACGSVAYGGVIAMPPPGPNRVANADAMIVGKVEGIEPQDVLVGTAKYRIAVVRISQGLRGVNDDKVLRVGFIPPPMIVGGNKGPVVISSGARDVQLQVGQEGLFILTKKAKENFYILGGPVGYFIGSEKNPSFEKEVQMARTTARLMEDPKAALKAKSPDERLLAAALLIGRYRSVRGPTPPRQEAIDAEESKLILQALGDADWQAQTNFNSLYPNPGQLFNQLGITAKDGFTPPPGGNFQAAVQNWLRDNAQKYRIQRFVATDTK